MKQNLTLLKLAAEAALLSGEAILEVYQSDEFGIEAKHDNSPLTIADKLANEIITRYLSPWGFPLLTEESSQVPFHIRCNWEKYWLVDPLDGTREFISRNEEFTVNIAFIERNVPVLGVIYAPAIDRLYLGAPDLGSFRIDNASARKLEINGDSASLKKMPLVRHEIFRIVASRSHMNHETMDFIEKCRKQHPQNQLVSIGSALKLCLLAEGEAHVYPRFAPTYEWDTAAGHAILLAAGGNIYKAGNKSQMLEYNKKDLKNPWFVAVGPGQQLTFNHGN